MDKDDSTANEPPVEVEVTDPIEDVLRGQAQSVLRGQAQSAPERRAMDRIKEEAQSGRRWSFIEKAALVVFGVVVGWVIKDLF
jgi:hypothetical protein